MRVFLCIFGRFVYFGALYVCVRALYSCVFVRFCALERVLLGRHRAYGADVGG